MKELQWRSVGKDRLYVEETGWVPGSEGLSGEGYYHVIVELIATRGKVITMKETLV